MTVNEVSKLTGVSIRTLQYYDNIGLLKPAAYTEAGYRMYDDTALERLQQILLFRELQFPLKDIKRMMESPDYDKGRALEQQIELLLLKKEHLENLITLARGIKLAGGNTMEFSAFDTTKIDEYAEQAKRTWGATPAYKEYGEKSKSRTPGEQKELGARLMDILAEFGNLKERPAADPAVTEQVKKLQSYITEHYYTCTKEILLSLGELYAAGGDFTKNINAAGGPGTAEFAGIAIKEYCNYWQIPE